jgi:PadR family transcriptional regulator, regulatory protein PadR
MGKVGAGELVQGTLPLLILRTLATGPNHGFAIARRIQQVSKDVLRVEEGSLYPALHRLEVQGWIASEWRMTENNRNAKYYRLTRAGRAQLEREATRWNAIADAIAAVLREA